MQILDFTNEMRLSLKYVYVCNVLCIVIYPTKNYVTRSNGMLIFEIDFPMVNISNL